MIIMNSEAIIPCCHCQDAENTFSKKMVQKELKKYHSNGPGKTTKMLVDYFKDLKEIKELTLLDIGGGIGAIQHELIKEGVVKTIHVDASTSYLEVSREEAERQDHATKSTWVFGDFIDIASTVPQTNIVTLESVICCYPDFDRLVSASSSKAMNYYAMVIPKRTWWTRLAASIANLYFKAKRRTFRFFVHPPEEIRSILKVNQFERCFYQSTWLDLIEVYERLT